MEKLMNFLKDEEGATAVEYGIMVALIAIVIIVVVRAVGVSLSEVFEEVNTSLDTIND